MGQTDLGALVALLVEQNVEAEAGPLSLFCRSQQLHGHAGPAGTCDLLRALGGSPRPCCAGGSRDRVRAGPPAGAAGAGANAALAGAAWVSSLRPAAADGGGLAAQGGRIGGEGRRLGGHAAQGGRLGGEGRRLGGPPHPAAGRPHRGARGEAGRGLPAPDWALRHLVKTQLS